MREAIQFVNNIQNPDNPFVQNYGIDTKHLENLNCVGLHLSFTLKVN